MTRLQKLVHYLRQLPARIRAESQGIPPPPLPPPRVRVVCTRGHKNVLQDAYRKTNLVRIEYDGQIDKTLNAYVFTFADRATYKTFIGVLELHQYQELPPVQ